MHGRLRVVRSVVGMNEMGAQDPSFSRQCAYQLMRQLIIKHVEISQLICELK